jgi:integrase
MATIRKRKGVKGDVSFLVQVKVSGFKSAAKTFRVQTTAAEARNAAEAWAKKLEEELRGQSARGGTRSDVAQLTVRRLVEEFLNDPRTKTLRTYEGMQRLLDFWVNAYGSMKTVNFGVLALHQARDRLNVPGRSPGTTNRYLGAMRSAWSWGRAAGLIPLERSWPSRLMLPEPRGRQRFLSDAEVDSLLKAAESDRVMKAAIVVSLSTGLRQGELLALTWADVDLAKGHATVHHSKNGEKRIVHLTATAVETLRDLRKSYVVSSIDAAQRHVFLVGPGKPLRTQCLEHRWWRIRGAAGLRDFRWHDMRHTCASILLQGGATLAQIAQVLGHKSLVMSMRYAHLVQGSAVTGHAALDAKLRGQA